MNKFALAAATAAALSTAAPVFAQEAPVADPFVSTQALGAAIGLNAATSLIIGTFVVVTGVVVASDTK